MSKLNLPKPEASSASQNSTNKISYSNVTIDISEAKNQLDKALATLKGSNESQLNKVLYQQSLVIGKYVASKNLLASDALNSLTDMAETEGLDRKNSATIIQQAFSEAAKPPDTQSTPNNVLGAFTGLKDGWDLPYNWLFKDWIPAGETCFIGGPSGHGKSFAVLEICGAVAFDVKAFGQLEAVNKGAVFYLTTEGLNGVQKRVKAYAEKHGVSEVALNKRFWQSDKHFTFKDVSPEEFTKVVKQMEIDTGEPCKMIVFDTFILYGGCSSENNSSDTGDSINWMKKVAQATGATVVAIHHSGKSSEDSPMKVGTNKDKLLRGSSNFGASAEVVLGVCKTPIVERDGQFNGIWVDKLKDAEPPEPIGFEIVNHQLKLRTGHFEDIGIIEVNGQMTPITSSEKRANIPSKQDIDLTSLLSMTSLESDETIIRKNFIDKLEADSVSDKTARNRWGIAKQKAIDDNLVIDQGGELKVA